MDKYFWETWNFLSERSATEVKFFWSTCRVSIKRYCQASAGTPTGLDLRCRFAGAPASSQMCHWVDHHVLPLFLRRHWRTFQAGGPSGAVLKLFIKKCELSRQGFLLCSIKRVPEGRGEPGGTTGTALEACILQTKLVEAHSWLWLQEALAPQAALLSSQAEVILTVRRWARNEAPVTVCLEAVTEQPASEQSARLLESKTFDQDTVKCFMSWNSKDHNL